jgi:hypothetical protein
MDSGAFIEPREIRFMAAGMAGDKEFKVIPKGFYTTLIQEAFNELNMSSLFMPGRKDYDDTVDEWKTTLTMELPEDCISVDDVYVFNGDKCGIHNSQQVHHKRNYYTEGNGYIANNKGHNGSDPYMQRTSALDKNMIRVDSESRPNNLLFFNIEGNRLMVSSSCKSWNKIHIKYRSTGGPMMDAPIIPLFYKSAIQDYVIESAFRYRMANEPSLIMQWSKLQQTYAIRLDKDGYNGSWHKAVMLSKSMSQAKLQDLKTYLGKAAWATGR